MSAPLFGTLRADFPTMSEWFAEEGKMASSGFEGHAAKRQRTDVEGYGVQLGNRVHGYWCNFLFVSLFFCFAKCRVLGDIGGSTKFIDIGKCLAMHAGLAQLHYRPTYFC